MFAGDLNGIIRSGWVLQPQIVMVLQPLISQLSGCDQLVVGPTHARGGTLDLMTDVPDLVWVSVVAPIGNSDHSSLLAVISMAQAVPNLCVSRKVFVKHQVNWNTVCVSVFTNILYENIFHGLSIFLALV